MDNYNDEECCGNWMIKWGQEERVKHQIACPELGYYTPEAVYSSIADWERINNKNWIDYLNP